MTDFIPYEHRPLAKGHQNWLRALEHFRRPGIEDGAGRRSNPVRTAQNSAVKIRYSAAARLFHKGFSTTVWNRTVAKTEALSRLGVSDYSSTRQLLAQPEIEAALRGKIVVQLSSGTPKDAREMDSWTHRRESRSHASGAENRNIVNAAADRHQLTAAPPLTWSPCSAPSLPSPFHDPSRTACIRQKATPDHRNYGR